MEVVDLPALVERRQCAAQNGVPFFNGWIHRHGRREAAIVQFFAHRDGEIFVTNQDPPNRHRRTPVNDVDLAENFVKIANDVLKLLLAGSDGAVQVEIGGGYAGGNSSNEGGPPKA